MGPKGRSYVQLHRSSQGPDLRNFMMASTNSNDLSESSWFAVWTRSRQEKSAAVMLEALGVQHFLPLKSEVHRWSDREQKVVTPLFSGYLFVRLNLTKDSRLRVLNTPGVAGLVGNQNGPMPIPDFEIENIHTVLTRKVQTSPYPFFAVGERVRVTRGALAGVEGRLIRSNTDSKLVISVEMIQQSIALSIHASDVEPVGPNTAHPGFQASPAVSLA
jgi:transcription antitermination factor NusG